MQSKKLRLTVETGQDVLDNLRRVKYEKGSSQKEFVNAALRRAIDDALEGKVSAAQPWEPVSVEERSICETALEIFRNQTQKDAEGFVAMLGLMASFIADRR